MKAPTTKGDILRLKLAFALRSVRTQRHRLGLTEEQRYAIADETIAGIRREGGWRELDEPATSAPISDGSQSLVERRNV